VSLNMGVGGGAAAAKQQPVDYEKLWDAYWHECLSSSYDKEPVGWWVRLLTVQGRGGA
jgi:hypothetical protein